MSTETAMNIEQPLITKEMADAESKLIVNENTEAVSTLFESDKLKVQGIAIHSGVSRNGIMYTAEELTKFSKTMEGVSIIKDHNAIVDNVIGVVEKTKSMDNGNVVRYEGWIKDKSVSEKIKDKMIRNVSIGALATMVKETEESEHLIATNIQGVELSVVVVPGVPGATIQQSLTAHENAKTVDEKLKIKPISEDVSKFISLEQWKQSKEGLIPPSPNAKVVDDSWDAPTLQDFTTKSWEELSDGQKSKIAKHYAWTPKMPPERFTDLKLPHHRPSDGAAVGNGVRNALARLSQTKGIPTSDMMRVRSHLQAHLEKINQGIELDFADNDIIVGVSEEQEQKEENKMVEESKLSEMQTSLAEKDMELAKLKASNAKLAEEKRQGLVDSYRKLCKEKNVEEQSVADMSEDVIKALVTQLEKTKVVVAQESKFKGQVGEPAQETKFEEALRYEKSSFGKGYSIFRESYDPAKHKRLAR